MTSNPFHRPRGWTLSLSGHGMLAIHCPITEEQAEQIHPRGFAPQVFEGNRYVTLFTGTIDQISFFAGIDRPLPTPCYLIAMPASLGETRGWWVLEAGIGVTLAALYARRFLQMPLREEPWPKTSLGAEGEIGLRLPKRLEWLFPLKIQGQKRDKDFKALPDSLDAFLAAQPNLIYPSTQNTLTQSPTYLPPMHLHRVDLVGEASQRLASAHWMERWSLIAWRPQRLLAAVPSLEKPEGRF